MNCPGFDELPSPPTGKKGWPWTVEKMHLSGEHENTQTFPKISIVTPSYNQGKFIEETIRSVLLQDYPNLEYIVLDGGSNDETVSILEKYDTWLKYWCSEPDNGQADAIYRGFEIASGDILAYINSDDFYYPGALKKVANVFASNPSCDWMTGRTVFIDEDEHPVEKQPKYLPINILTMTYLGCFVTQPSTFWKRDFFFDVGGFDKNLRFCFDYELFMKFLEVKRPCWIDENLATFRIHSMSKSSTIRDVHREESEKIRNLYKKKNALLINATGNFLGSIYSFIFNFRH